MYEASLLYSDFHHFTGGGLAVNPAKEWHRRAPRCNDCWMPEPFLDWRKRAAAPNPGPPLRFGRFPPLTSPLGLTRFRSVGEGRFLVGGADLPTVGNGPTFVLSNLDDFHAQFCNRQHDRSFNFVLLM